MGNVSSRHYREGVLDARDFPLDELAERLASGEGTVWVDLVGPTAEQLDELADELGLHELAVEDALAPHERPKIDRYGSHLFVSCHAVRLDRTGMRLEVSEVDAFVGERWVITVRPTDAYDIAPVLARWDASPELVAQGPGALVYTLLDDMVDRYFAVLDEFEAYYDQVSDDVFAEHPLRPEQQREWFEMRRMLSRFHRLLVPMREALGSLVRREHELAKPEMLPYWQDLYDHVLVATESTDSLREIAGSLVEANLSLRDFRQNQVMKKVSSWAAIVAAPTLITGYYGMNVPFPGSGDTAGVVASTLIIACVSVGLWWLFRRRGWL
jgi:magnesium transporter